MAAKKSTDKTQLKLFQPDFAGHVSVKDQLDVMVNPFFSLSKKKRISKLEYRNESGTVHVLVNPHQDYGMASIYDADILMYAMSQIMEAKNRDEEISPRIQMSRYDILEFLGKGTGGKEYKRLRSALGRLSTTYVETSIRKEDYKYEQAFTWISNLKIKREKDIPVAIEFTLCDWLYAGILKDRVLTVPKSYFRLESGLDRFLFKLFTSRIGTKGKGWFRVKLEHVHSSSGLKQPISRFKTMVQKSIDEQSVEGFWMFIKTHPSSKEEYLCAVSKKEYKSLSDAEQELEFFNSDKQLKRGRKNREN